jgi:hypothetical protein
MPDFISLPEAARLVGLGWQATWTRLLNGQLEGQQVGGRWLVDRGSALALAARLQAERQAKAARVAV